MYKNIKKEHLINCENAPLSSNGSGDPSVRDYLNEVGKEVIRLTSLGIKLVNDFDYMDVLNDVPPQSVPTSLGLVNNVLNIVKDNNNIKDSLFTKLTLGITSPAHNLDSVLQNLVVLKNTDELFCMSFHHLGHAIGLYNKEVLQETYYRTGKKQVESGVLSNQQYMKDHWAAFKVTSIILREFYSKLENRGYKPNLVIDKIEILCLENGIMYPESREGKKFTRVIKVVLKGIFKGESIKGPAKKAYRSLSISDFSLNYTKYLKPYINTP
ncbi:hypothetical protein [Colwellia psychrerythraea]|uniref:Uncharacterized protein n=1 Tax=Colwellia psychrerythraea (strain 34H / ATCC BAA-681) TaxID=167879 RepID=Q483M0_COLP3|nr:hypothetical protein [Colwellia psychrerythraea]AAZ28240.1 hypothetical protein CPS_2016 [Colwellia psychrerythraea 34H]